ncbi:MAG: hypothetical protein N2652_02445 [Kiritimatiellae bacterium]|nr:hypothetical protein [Kiritimatiellia bacterium]
MSMITNGLDGDVTAVPSGGQERRLSGAPPLRGRRPELDLDLEDGGESLDSLVRMFWTIEEALGDSQNVVRLPSRLFLENLPEELRGPRWRPDLFPAVVVEVDSWDLLCKIKMGRVTYPLARIIHDLPPGWVVGAPDAELVLDLAGVLEVLPTHLREKLKG